MRAEPHLHRRRLALAGLLVVWSWACHDTATAPHLGDDTPTDPVLYNPDWTAATQEKGAPRYGVVFPQDSVPRLDITLTAEQWLAIRANMIQLWGIDFGGGSAGAAPNSSVDPDYVDATVAFGGLRWRHVGFRPKGHTSLRYSWGSGTHKLPFRLHFDRFEDEYPQVDDQRFHGFRELSLAPAFADRSLMRERLAAELFRDAGVPAARTAFYRVYLDVGNGPEYAGVYTAVEVIDDTMVKEAFGDDAGNIYKPESRWDRFQVAEFEKKNNKAEADYADVRAAIEALNDPVRLRDPAAWREGLEATFDVDHFLRWLAVSNALVNKDSYGAHARNYYLYAHPSRGLVWIPWDHNVALNGSPGASGGPGRASDDGLSLEMDEVGDAWPLIRFTMDDPVYRARYNEHLRWFAEERFTPGRVEERLDRFESLITPWVVGAQGEQPGYSQLTSQGQYDNGVAELRRHILDRRALLGRHTADPR